MLPIVQYPDSVLLRQCEEVDHTTGIKAAYDLLESMRGSKPPGLGLSAPQIGLSARVFVMDAWLLKISGDGVFINPKILHVSSKTTSQTEGCLSYENGSERFLIRRPHKITISAMNALGVIFKMKLEGLAARCALHECDHLDGINIVDKCRWQKEESRKRIVIEPNREELLLRAIFGEN